MFSVEFKDALFDFKKRTIVFVMVGLLQVALVLHWLNCASLRVLL